MPELTDRITATGTADLAGLARINPVNAGYAMPGNRQHTVLSGAGGVTDSGLALDTLPSAVIEYELMYPNATDVVLDTDIDFSPKGLNRNQTAIGEHVNEIQLAGSSDSFSPVAEALFFRPDLKNQTVLPRPVVDEIPIWLGVGGSPESFIRAGRLGLPLMVAVIGGNTSRFRPLVDLYRQAWAEAGHPAEKQKVGLHSPGYVTANTQEALETYFPGYVTTTAKIARERGWPRATWQSFMTQAGPKGAFVIGDPQVVADKILRHSAALGGVDRFTFQMDIAGLSHDQLMESITLIGNEVAPRVKSQ